MPITVEAHRDQILAAAAPLPVGYEPILDAIGLVTATDVAAKVQVPPFNNAAMDGFAVRHAGVTPGVSIAVSQDIPAGIAPRELAPGTVARIMTGAMVPAGADTVIPVELSDSAPSVVQCPDTVTFTEIPAPGAHIRRAGENVTAGDIVIPARTVITPAVVAAAASIGYAELPVHRRPRVAIIATGDELAPPGQPLQPGQIPDSNSFLLAGLARQQGAQVVAVTRSGDDPAQFAATLRTAARVADVVITSGGISAGAYDVVKLAGLDAHFTKVLMQPGKPQGWAQLAGEAEDGAAILLCLPGNPVSVFVSFHLFVRPVLARLAGADTELRTFQARATVGWSSPRGRRQFVPVHHAGGEATPTHRLGSGSHLIATLHRANALAIVPEDETSVTVGQTLDLVPCSPI